MLTSIYIDPESCLMSLSSSIYTSPTCHPRAFSDENIFSPCQEKWVRRLRDGLFVEIQGFGGFTLSSILVTALTNCLIAL